MRIVVLGGAGSLGRACARTLAASPDLESATLADLDAGRATAIADELGPRFEAVRVDVTQHSELADLLRGHELVVNCVGPYKQFSCAVLDAAIATGTAYVDACDDAQVTLDLLGRHGDALQAGVSAVLGCGLSPGLSNLLAVVAARELDDVVNLYTGWSVDAGEGGFRTKVDLVPERDGVPSSALRAWFERISADVELQIDGARHVLPTLEAHHLHFPGIGSGTAWTSGHPETLTLPRTIVVSGDCLNLMVMKRVTAAYLEGLRRDISTGRIGIAEGPAMLIDRPTRRRIKAWFASMKTGGGGALPTFFAVAEGGRGGPSLRVGAQLTSLPAGFDNAAGVTLALAAELLLAGPAVGPGVFTPEQAFEPDMLLERLGPWCYPPPARPDALVEVTIEQI